MLFNRRGNNPYCHYRTLEFASRGLREWVVRSKPGTGLPFGHGVFGLVEEAAWLEDDSHHFTYAGGRMEASTPDRTDRTSQTPT